jgi:predicted transcriptional regulator
MTRPWTQADLIRLKSMAGRKVSAADIARSLGRRVGSVKAKIREMRLVPLKKSRTGYADVS